MYGLLLMAAVAGNAPDYRVPTQEDCALREHDASIAQSAWCWHDAAELALEPAATSFEKVAALASAADAPFEARLAHADLLRLRGDPQGLSLLRELEAVATSPAQRLRVATPMIAALLAADDVTGATAVAAAHRGDADATVDAAVRTEFDVAVARLELHRMHPEAAWQAARRLRERPEPTYRNQREILLLLGAAGHDTGRLAAAYDSVVRLHKLARGVGDRAARGRAYFLELSLLSNSAELRRKIGREALMARAREAIAFARGWSSTAHTMMGCLVGPTLGPEGEPLLRRCVDFHREHGLFEHQNVESLSQLAMMRIDIDPKEAFALSDEAIAIVRASEHPTPHTIVAFHRAWMHWHVGERQEGFAFAEEAIAALERLRDEEASDPARARAQAFWGSPYHHMLTSLLFDATPPPRSDIDRALRVIADLRGATLVASMRQAGIADPDGSDRDVGLAAVQSALSEGEAMVIYQLTKVDDSVTWSHPTLELPSFVLVVSAEGAAVLPLGNGPRLDARVRTAADLLRRGVAPQTVGSALWTDLVAPVLDALPDTVDKLVLVPDGSLWQLPFEALREHANALRLVERFSLSVTPSPSVWLTLRERGRPNSGGTLALADPPLPPDIELAPLPGSRDEAARVVETAGAGLVLLGADASESRLRSAALADYGAIHFAVHALTDAHAPERSALVLASDDAHDGMLHPADIAKLELDDALVVLSACSAASGEVIAGEGVIGLARAFLQAGARAVVATPAPIRDRDAMTLFTAIHRHLADGLRVDEAVALAQRARIADGAPVEAWSVVVVGDASLRLPGRHELPWPRLLLALGAAALLGLAMRFHVAARDD